MLNKSRDFRARTGRKRREEELNSSPGENRANPRAQKKRRVKMQIQARRA